MMKWAYAGMVLITCWYLDRLPADFDIYINGRGETSPACSLMVDAGPDTNVCAPGGNIGLMGSITGNYLFYQWTPATGLSNPLSLTPTATVTGPVTYTLMAYSIDPTNPNLVVNGNFSAGNTGFISDYTYVADIPGIQNEMVPEGTYTVINNPNLVHTGFSPCSDHTGGGGNMMVVNGAASLQDVWCQTITVTANTYYNVSAWVASVNPASPAKLRFSINGMPIGAVVDALSTPCVWVPFNAVWNSGSSTSATICILNLNTALGGNDFALDDISMVQLCSVSDEVNITLLYEVAPVPVISGPAFLCEGETGVYEATVPAQPPVLMYNWILPPGATILSGQGTPTITVNWNTAQEGSLCLEIHTRCDMNDNCFEVTVGSQPALPLITGPTSLCPGESATFYTPELDPDDFFSWIIPPGVTLISGAGTNEITIEWASPGDVEICVEVTNACGSTDNCTFLSLFPAYQIMFDTTLCASDTIVINGHTYGNGNWSGTEVFTTQHGCDSIVEIAITPASALEFMFTEILCPGDSIFLQGAFQTQEGIYTDSFTTQSDCDSLVITTVIISPFDTTWIQLSTCDPDSAGQSIITYSLGNCDSTVVTSVILSPTDTIRLFVPSCSPADTGLVIQSFTNTHGCDSTIYTHTFLQSSDTTLLFENSCDSADVGIMETHFTNRFGCDSTVVLSVAFALADTTQIYLTSCMYADTGVTSSLFVNRLGCDSLVITSTVYGGSDTLFFISNTCSPADSGLAILTLTNHLGCDSIISTYTFLLPADTTYLNATSCDPLDTGLISQVFANAAGCDSIVFTSTTLSSVHLCQLEVNTILDQPLCFGDTAKVSMQIPVGLSPVTITWQHSTLPVSGSAVVNAVPATEIINLSIPGIYFIETASANGIRVSDTLVIHDVPELAVDVIAQLDAFGYGISCAGDSSGMAMVTFTGTGTPPYQYTWTDGSTAQTLMNLTAGLYSATVTDSHGCTDSGEVLITSPPAMSYLLVAEDIDCAGFQNGGISVTQATGGIAPWVSSLNGKPFEAQLVYPGLGPGTHLLIIQDQNGCEALEEIVLTEPENWTIHLGPDTLVEFGSVHTVFVVISGQPSGSVNLKWSDGYCEDCFDRTVIMEDPVLFSVTATDEKGCKHTDAVLIEVFLDRKIYIPNVFSPNGDGINDIFSVYAGRGLSEIAELSLYDRWGSLVFMKTHISPDDPLSGWDGSLKGKSLNPGVYVYKVVLVFKDGHRVVKYGDITLLR